MAGSTVVAPAVLAKAIPMALAIRPKRADGLTPGWEADGVRWAIFMEQLLA
jgi:hypothetical protein